MGDVKYLEIAELRRLGFLQEANRQFFHPHGLALEVRSVTSDWTDEEIARSPWMQEQVEKIAGALEDRWIGFALDGGLKPEGWEKMAVAVCRSLWPQGSRHLSGVWDYRDDPEGIVYGSDPEGKLESAQRAVEERERHWAVRCRLFGTTSAAGASPRFLALPPDVEPTRWVMETQVEED